MGARKDLNRHHVIGTLGFAGLLGLASGSWAVFAVVVVALIAGSAYAGEIRPDKRGRRRE